MAVHPDPTWFLNHRDLKPIITVLPNNAGAPPTPSLLHFNQLHDLEFTVRRALVEGLDYTRPNQIQSSCLPLICRPPYDSLLGQARPGCGTSMLDAISLMNRINSDLRAPQSLCLVPTLDVGLKVLKCIQRCAIFCGIKYVLVSEATVSKPPVTDQIVIGLPDTICSLVSHGSLSLENVNIVVYNDLRSILSQGGMPMLRATDLMVAVNQLRGPRRTQVVVFSSLLDDVVKRFWTDILDGRVFNRVFVNVSELARETAHHIKVKLDHQRDKIPVLEQLLRVNMGCGQVIVFCSNKNVKMLKKTITAFGLRGLMLTAPELVEDEDTAFINFKIGVLRSLLTSREELDWRFDLSEVTMVVHYDLPVIAEIVDYDVYYNRTTRTGRCTPGIVVHLLCGAAETKSMEGVETYFGTAINKIHADFESIRMACKTAGILEPRKGL